MKEKLPLLTSDEDAEDFVASADLTDYDLSQGQRVRFEFKKKSTSVTLRLPPELLDELKAEARRDGMPYQRFIRLQLERALAQRHPEGPDGAG